MISLVPLLSPFLQEQEGSYFFPVQASEFAADTDWLFHFILWVSVVSFVLVVGVTGWFIWRYRQAREPEPQPSATHSVKLELIWSIIPSIFLVIMFWEGFQVFVDHRNPPPSADRVDVIGSKWLWTFRYPNGAELPELHVIKDRPVRLVLQSKDVLHSVWIPAFRVKMDAVPGRYTQLWFTPTIANGPDEFFPLLCTEYCGTQHSSMNSKVVVHPNAASFQTWMNEATVDYDPDPEKWADNGALVYKNKGCQVCHSIDGTTAGKVGPSFKGVFGANRPLASGESVLADENYLLESIENPIAKVVANYAPAMAVNGGVSLSKEEKDYLVAFIKSLAD